MTSLRELQWLQAKANVLNHITAPDQLRSLQLTFVTWEEGSEIFLERCTELRSLALSVVEESEKTALSRSWRNRRPSGRDCHLLRYLPNLVKFQLNVAPRLLFQKLSKHCKLLEYVAIGEDIGDDVTHPPGLDDIISSLDKLESLSLPSVRRLSLRMSVDYGQHPPQMMPILLNRIVTTFPNLEELKVDIAVGVSNISLDWSSFTSKLSILGNLVKLTIRLDTQTGSVGKLWRHLPTSVESIKLIIARPMKGLRSSVMDLIKGLGDWNRFPELTSLSLYAPGVDTVELLKAIEENCDLTTVNVVGELGNSNGSAILTALKSLATACPRVRSVGLGVDHLRQLSDEDWSKVPFAQLRPLFDYIQSANDNDDDSWDEDNRPKKCRRVAFVDDDDASHDEAANHDDVTSHEDEDEYESDFVVSDDQVSFETDASLSSEFDEGEL
uniref:Uncharacterized protein n=1 Tax=Plectus sambesii TaxID=2011161 RepID=A0A914XGR7_9BILA